MMHVGLGIGLLASLAYCSVIYILGMTLVTCAKYCTTKMSNTIGDIG